MPQFNGTVTARSTSGEVIGHPTASLENRTEGSKRAWGGELWSDDATMLRRLDDLGQFQIELPNGRLGDVVMDASQEDSDGVALRVRGTGPRPF
jgi:hypothetical protein